MVTQKDIARRLGVSTSLVSHVLAGRGPRLGASVATMERIRQEAARQGYQPSTAALVLRGQSARLIGVVVKDFNDPYLGHLVGELQRLALEAGYALLVTGCAGGPAPTAAVAPLMRYPLDGILLAGSDVRGEWFQPFVAQGLRGVQVGTGARIAGMCRVCVDEAWGMARVTEHLVQLGHRQIAFAGHAGGAHQRRRAAFEAGLHRAGLTPVNIAAWQAADRAGLEQALNQPRRALAQAMTAIVCADDEVAQIVMHAAYLQQQRVPQDLSVTGMDDIPFARLMTPALTTVRQPLEPMIHAAFRLLVDADAIGAETPPAVLLRPELIVRETSTAPCERNS